MITKTQTDPMEEAYRLIGGDPAIDAVSVAAKGGIPETDSEQRMRKMAPKDALCQDINHAYAMLFESLAAIMKAK